MKFSPLFWPVQLKGNSIYILDELALPQKLSYIKVNSYQQAAKIIKQMKTRAVGQVLLVMYIFLLVARQHKNNKNLISLLEKVSQAIDTARPTLSFKLLTDMVLSWAKNGAPLEKNILEFLEMLKNKRIQQAEEVSKLIEDGDIILTHCNISGLMPLIAEFCRREKKRISFFVTETRPYLQGMRLTAWELIRARIPVTVITDNMVAWTMQKKKISKVIVGADNLAQNQDIANKVGTYQIAILAKYLKIPFYVLCPPVSVAKTGRDIKIEIRPDKEFWEYIAARCVPKGIKCYYPAFDITPKELITRYIHLDIKMDG